MDKTPLSKPMNKLPELFKAFASLFNTKPESLNATIDKLPKTSSSSCSQICAKQLNGVGAWSCKDCEKDSTCVICNDCYENSKEKHTNHRVVFKAVVRGCCDCGDPDAWAPDGFCSNHSGLFTSEAQINDLILSILGKALTDKMQTILIKMISIVIDIISTNPDATIKTNEDLKSFIDFIKGICKNNDAVMHIVSELFIRSYDYKTKHQCVKMSQASIEVIPKPDDSDVHQCQCPFMMNIMKIYDCDNKTNSDFFLIFLRDYRIKTVMGIAIFAVFNELLYFNRISVLDLSVQVISDDFSHMLLSSPEFMLYYAKRLKILFTELLNKINYDEDNTSPFQKKDDYVKLSKAVERMFCNFLYMIKEKTHKLFTTHIDFYKEMIDLIYLGHNANILKPVTAFKKDAFKKCFIDYDIIILELFNVLMSLFDFSNEANAMTLLRYFHNKFNQSKLESDAYSFHISLQRAFSIFLSAFTISRSIMNHTTMKESMDYIIKEVPFDYEIIIGELLKFFGFITSIKQKYWVYYGETMLHYVYFYHNIELFPNADFSLLKLLCSSQQYSHILRMPNLFYFTNVVSTNQGLHNLLIKPNTNPAQVDLDWTKDDSKPSKAILFGHDLLLLLTSILRSNETFLNIFYLPYKDISRAKVIPSIYNSFAKLEHEAMPSIIKSKLAHIILSNGDKCTYSTIEKSLGILYKSFVFKEDLMEFIKEITINSAKTKERQEVLFSLKPECYAMIDLSLISDNTTKADIERFIMNFKRKEIDLLQTVKDIPMIGIERELQKELERGFYCKETIEWIVYGIKAMVECAKWEDVMRYYLLSMLRLVNIWLMTVKGNLEMIEEYKEIAKVLEKALSSGKMDDSQRNACEYVRRNVIEIFKLDEVGKGKDKDNEDKKNEDIVLNVQQNNEEEAKKKAQRDLQKQKIKNKFKNNYDTFIAQNKDNEIPNPNPNDNTNPNTITTIQSSSSSNPQCVICRSEIPQSSFISNPYGRFAMATRDHFLFNIKTNPLKEIFNSTSQLSSKFSYSFSSFLNSDPNFKKIPQSRLVTCNHYVHISCYDTFLINQFSINNIASFPCPFCKIASNLCLPHINLSLFKGINFKDFLASDDWIILTKPSIPQPWQRSINTFIEDLISTSERIFIKDLDENETAHGIFHMTFLNQFKSFFVYFENYTAYQVEIMGITFAALRSIVVLTQQVNHELFVRTLKQYIKLLIEGKCVGTIDQGVIGRLFIEGMFYYMILIEDSWEEEHLKYLLRLYMPYFLVEIYLKVKLEEKGYQIGKEVIDNDGKMKEELIAFAEKDECKGYINHYLRKMILCRKIMTYNDTTSNNDADADSDDNADEATQYSANLHKLNIADQSPLSLLTLKTSITFPKQKDPYDIITNLLQYLKSPYQSNEITNQPSISSITLTPSLLSLNLPLKFKFIPLPSNILDLASQVSQKPCVACNQSTGLALICLICGDKVCNSRNCYVKNSQDATVQYNGYYYHNIKCCGGNIAYISLTNGEVIFASKQKAISSKCFVYLNQYGEEPKENKSITNEYVFAKQEMNKAMNAFVSFSYRKINENVDIDQLVMMLTNQNMVFDADLD